MREQATHDLTGAPRVRTDNTEPSKTVQSDAHLADLNVIMSEFLEEGRDILGDTELMFADVSDFGDYQDVMLEVRRAEETFMALPSKVREIFNHNVTEWLDTAHDQDKREKLVEAGFIKAVEVPETPAEPVVAKEEAGGEEEGGPVAPE